MQEYHSNKLKLSSHLRQVPFVEGEVRGNSKNIEYFYSPPENISEDSIILYGETYKHLTKVLRKKIDDEIIVVDGLGNIFNSLIGSINKDSIKCRILERRVSTNEASINMTLALGLLKNPSKFDFVVEKATELGVNKIIPIRSDFSIGKSNKTERWKNIAIAAMQQSLRATLPEISSCMNFKDMVNEKVDIKILADMDSEYKLDYNLSKFRSVLIAVGPEGGFSEEEVSFAINNGFKSLKLSKMRLRSETAAITAIVRLLDQVQ